MNVLRGFLKDHFPRYIQFQNDASAKAAAQTDSSGMFADVYTALDNLEEVEPALRDAVKALAGDLKTAYANLPNLKQYLAAPKAKPEYATNEELGEEDAL
eukprot:TRINITY_DN1017_c0_g2_i1.p3 TRINITY_DN1017_c0_g2~~TRINITY_DN1017_c0_g2_i1.p3  ORF type:complete len:100 (+),score=37.96 TRINITY_DN1017_c0_g2_i1:324-623(+)